jgi:septal ring factor EnvC (AmiA/AmiB activator)
MKLLPVRFLLLAASATIPALCQSSTKSNLVSTGTATAAPTTTASAAPASTATASAPAASTASASPTAPTKPAATAAPPVSAGALRSDIAHQDRVIKNQIDTQQALLKKNQELAKQAAKLDEKNKKLADKNKKLEAKNKAFNDEKQRNEAQNADLARKHDAIKAAEKPIATQ